MRPSENLPGAASRSCSVAGSGMLNHSNPLRGMPRARPGRSEPVVSHRRLLCHLGRDLFWYIAAPQPVPQVCATTHQATPASVSGVEAPDPWSHGKDPWSQAKPSQPASAASAKVSSAVTSKLDQVAAELRQNVGNGAATTEGACTRQ